MNPESSKQKSPRAAHLFNAMHMLPLTAIVCAILLTASGCRDEKKDIIPAALDMETYPSMRTDSVSTLISDSGITRYRIETPLWLMYEEASEPYWRFPDGLHLEKFDQMLRKEASIDADSATYFKQRQLWRLDGYVNIRNTLGEKFLTNQLFWDQRQQKIYSDSFIHIERQGKIIEGYGFESDERMTRYEVLRVSAIFPASQFRSDSTKAARATAANAVDSGPQQTTTIAPNGQPVPHIVVPSTRNQQPRALDAARQRSFKNVKTLPQQHDVKTTNLKR